jgi:hypothetical protein
MDFFDDGAAGLRDRLATITEQFHNFRRRKFRSPKRVIHDKRSATAELVPYRQRRRRLHIDAAKRRLAADLAVGDGVHRAAARECDIA